MSKLIAHLRLMRPANIITAIADILAGFAVSGAAYALFSTDFPGSTALLYSLIWLIMATIGLYGGGVVFNDVFDAELDKVERPERPIPSGLATVRSAAILAILLLIGGILAAFQVSVLSGVIAIIIAALAVLYDAWGKHQLIFGPINMGLCRGWNLLLGISAVPAAVFELWFLAFIPVVYIAAITMISRGEVHGKNRKALLGGSAMYVSIIIALIVISLLEADAWWQILPFVLLFCYLIFPPLVNAIKNQDPRLIGKAVKAGVLSLIVLNAILATAFAGWLYGAVLLLLLPVSIGVAKRFAVT